MQTSLQFAWNVKAYILWKKKEEKINFSSAEFAQRALKVKGKNWVYEKKILELNQLNHLHFH